MHMQLTHYHYQNANPFIERPADLGDLFILLDRWMKQDPERTTLTPHYLPNTPEDPDTLASITVRRDHRHSGGYSILDIHTKPIQEKPIQPSNHHLDYIKNRVQPLTLDGTITVSNVTKYSFTLWAPLTEESHLTIHQDLRKQRSCTYAIVVSPFALHKVTGESDISDLLNSLATQKTGNFGFYE